MLHREATEFVVLMAGNFIFVVSKNVGKFMVLRVRIMILRTNISILRD